jgi:hypothetical protein
LALAGTASSVASTKQVMPTKPSKNALINIATFFIFFSFLKGVMAFAPYKRRYGKRSLTGNS